MLDRARLLPYKALKCVNIEESLAFDDYFDAIICVGVFEFIRDIHSLLQRISASMNDGGVFGFTMPVGTFKIFNEFISMADSCGLKLIKCEQFFGYKDSGTNESVEYNGILLKKVSK
jgi:SAM-dependent methyltransferase